MQLALKLCLVRNECFLQDKEFAIDSIPGLLNF